MILTQGAEVCICMMTIWVYNYWSGWLILILGVFNPGVRVVVVSDRTMHCWINLWTRGPYSQPGKVLVLVSLPNACTFLPDIYQAAAKGKGVGNYQVYTWPRRLAQERTFGFRKICIRQHLMCAWWIRTFWAHHSRCLKSDMLHAWCDSCASGAADRRQPLQNFMQGGGRVKGVYSWSQKGSFCHVWVGGCKASANVPIRGPPYIT